MPSPTSHFFLLFQQSTVAFFDRMMIYGALDIVFQAIRREAWLKVMKLRNLREGRKRYWEDSGLSLWVRKIQFPLQIHRSGTAVGAQRRKRGEPQHAGSYLCPGSCAGRRSARLSLLPFCQTASAFRLICLFHTFFRCGVYRAMAFAPLRCP